MPLDVFEEFALETKNIILLENGQKPKITDNAYTRAAKTLGLIAPKG